MTKEEISIVPFTMEYQDDYYNGFNTEIKKTSAQTHLSMSKMHGLGFRPFWMRCKQDKHCFILFFPGKASFLQV